MNTETLLDKLTRAITHQYTTDASCPSVIVSYIKGQYYCSIVRYTKNFGEGKKIVCTSTNQSMNKALLDISNKFLNQVAPANNPIEDLVNFARLHNE